MSFAVPNAVAHSPVFRDDSDPGPIFSYFVDGLITTAMMLRTGTDARVEPRVTVEAVVLPEPEKRAKANIRPKSVNWVKDIFVTFPDAVAKLLGRAGPDRIPARLVKP